MFTKDLIFEIVLFLVGFLLLIKGGDWFVDGACGIAKRFHVPELLIGATVVSIGTTLPEVMVSCLGAAKGSGEMAYGNAIGSIICNTALIAAITIAVRPSKVDKKTLRLPVLFFFISAAIYCFIAYYFKTFSRFSGIILLAIFVIYMIISTVNAVKHPDLSAAAENAEQDDEPEEKDGKESSALKDIILLVVGAIVIAVGAKLLVDNGQKIAETFGVPESVIALTFVALGTSLPELVTAITSLVKGHGALSLGNIVGANLFNLVLVSGASITIAPFKVPVTNVFMGYNTSLIIEIPLMLLVMAFMTLPALIRGKLSRFQGITLLVLYAAFCAFQFIA